MYCLTLFCYCCLQNKTNLVDINKTDARNISHKEKLIFCELIEDDDLLLNEVPKVLCQDCVKDIEFVHNFRKTFLQKQKYLRGYILDFFGVNTSFINSYGNLSVDVVNVDKFLSSYTKTEDDSSDDEGTFVENNNDLEKSVEDEDLFEVDVHTVNFTVKNQFLQKDSVIAEEEEYINLPIEEDNDSNLVYDDLNENISKSAEETQENDELVDGNSVEAEQNSLIDIIEQKFDLNKFDFVELKQDISSLKFEDEANEEAVNDPLVSDEEKRDIVEKVLNPFVKRKRSNSEGDKSIIEKKLKFQDDMQKNCENNFLVVEKQILSAKVVLKESEFINEKDKNTVRKLDKNVEYDLVTNDKSILTEDFEEKETYNENQENTDVDEINKYRSVDKNERSFRDMGEKNKLEKKQQKDVYKHSRQMRKERKDDSFKETEDGSSPVEDFEDIKNYDQNQECSDVDEKKKYLLVDKKEDIKQKKKIERKQLKAVRKHSKQKRKKLRDDSFEKTNDETSLVEDFEEIEKYDQNQECNDEKSKYILLDQKEDTTQKKKIEREQLQAVQKYSKQVVKERKYDNIEELIGETSPVEEILEIDDDLEDTDDEMSQSGVLTIIRTKEDHSLKLVIKKDDTDTCETSFYCEICGLSFNLENDLKIHSLTHKKAEYDCIFCDYKFKNDKLLAEHERTHPKNKLYQCKICHRILSNKRVYKQHYCQHSGNFLYRCNICDKGLTSKNNLIAHEKRHYDKANNMKSNVSEASVTPDKSVDTSREETKRRMSERPKLHRSRISSEKIDDTKKFDAGTSNKISVDTSKEETKPQMSERSQKLRKSNNISTKTDDGTKKSHIKRPCTSSDLHCKICDIDFASKQSCERHCARFHTVNKCEVCGRAFDSFAKCGVHQRYCGNQRKDPEKTQSKNEPKQLFECYICRKNFNLKIKLKKHLIKHQRNSLLESSSQNNGVDESESQDGGVDKTEPAAILVESQSENGGDEETSQNGVSKTELIKRKAGRPRKIRDNLETPRQPLRKPGRPPRHDKITKEQEFSTQSFGKSETKTKQCKFCGKKFMNQMVLDVHMLVHMDSSNYPCQFCSRVFVSDEMWQAHVNRSHNSTYDRCPHCSKLCRNLSKHILMIHANTSRTYSCAFCDKTFLKLQHLRNHKKQHKKEEMMYPCPECDKKFREKFRLIRHIVVHTGKRHKCNYCDKKYSVVTDLNRHIKTSHSDEKLLDNIVDE